MKKGSTIHIIEKSFRHHVVEWGATFLTAIGAVLNARLYTTTLFDGYIASFYLWLFANFLWISFAIKHKHWGVLTTFTILGIINLLAILKNLGINLF